MKLSGWLRLGIVASVIWCLGVIGMTLQQYYFPNSQDSSLLVAWETTKPKPWEIDWQDSPPKEGDAFDPDEYLLNKGMSQKEIDSLQSTPKFRWVAIFSLALVPPLLLLFLVTVSRITILWIYAGFKDSP